MTARALWARRIDQKRSQQRAEWKTKDEDYGSQAVFSVNVRLVLAEFGDIPKREAEKESATVLVDSSSMAAL